MATTLASRSVEMAASPAASPAAAARCGKTVSPAMAV